MTTGGGYELDLSSPVGHVAAEMEGAGPDGPALTVEAMAAGYHHPVRGDLARIQRHEGVTSDEEAVRWLIRRAIEELDGQVTRDGDGYRLAKPFAGLRWRGRPVARVTQDDNPFGDLFSPLTGGRFAENIRTDKVSMAKDNLDELRESMRNLGWVKEFPAMTDQRGVVLVGHRRMKVAKELGIEPVVKVLPIGEGTAADAERLRIAIASNLGFRPMSPTDRKNIAEALYQDGWSMERIGEALQVSTKTVSRDLEDICHDDKSERKDSKGRKASPGRPRKPRKADDPQLQEVVRNRYNNGEPIRRKEVAKQFGVGEDTVTRAIEQVRGAAAPAAQPPAGHAHNWQPVHAFRCSCGAIVEAPPA